MDKQSKLVLNAIIEKFNANERFVKISYLIRHLDIKHETILMICNHLEESGKIEYVSKDKELVSPKIEQLHPVTYSFENFGKYLKEKWIDILSLGVSITALIISIIALNS